MIQFEFLSGSTAGGCWVARRFPVRLGRAAANDLRLEEDGVWEHHAEVTLDVHNGFVLRCPAEALLTINGEPVAEARLQNGDTIQLGSVRLRFWLAPTSYRGLKMREWVVWGTLVAMTIIEMAVACALP